MCFGTNQPMVRMTAALKADTAGDLVFPPPPPPPMATTTAPELAPAPGVVNVRASVRDFSLHSLRFPDTDEDMLLTSVFGMPAPPSPAVAPVAVRVSDDNNNDNDNDHTNANANTNDDAIEVQPEPELGTAAMWAPAAYADGVCWAKGAANEAEEEDNALAPAPASASASPATSAAAAAAAAAAAVAGGSRTAPDSAAPKAARTVSTTQDRLERNRAAAAQSRLRKKMRTAALEAEARSLEARQADLRGGIARLALENAVLRTELADLRNVLAQSAAHFGSHLLAL